MASVGVGQSVPLVIGATGGSGTRVVARIAKKAGYNLGANLNSAEDALEFYGFFDAWVDPFVLAQRQGRTMTPWQLARMKEDFYSALARHIPEAERRGQLWGWKAPRSIYLLPFLHSECPHCKFVHLLRDGRDMALSANQNQLRKHGAVVLRFRERLSSSTSVRSILLWQKINLLAADFGESRMGKNYLRIRFEELCGAPAETVKRILDFLGSSIDPEAIARAEIEAPKSLGRWRECAPRVISRLEREGGAALQRFGYL